VVAGVALQLFTLGIPCIYYGTEPAFAGPEAGERRWLPEWKTSDRYLREAMFGPEHPLRPGRAGLDPSLRASTPPCPASALSGRPDSTASIPRAAPICASRRSRMCVRVFRCSVRGDSTCARPRFSDGRSPSTAPASSVAWSRILDDEEAVCVLNSHGGQARGSDVLIDASLNAPGRALTVVVNTAHVGGTGRRIRPVPPSTCNGRPTASHSSRSAICRRPRCWCSSTGPEAAAPGSR
jgi:hypothetical protein